MRLVQLGGLFGKWTIVDGPFYDSRGKRKQWHCYCECGSESLVTDYDLKADKSLGCRTCGSKGPKSELARGFSHVSKDVFKKVRAAAQNAIARCTDTNHSRYADWGGRGIEVRFKDKDSFVQYILTLPGYDDLLLVIDRIDNDKHYEIGNLRWVTRSDSQRNQRHQGGDCGYFVKYGFDAVFKRLHDRGLSFQDVGELYCANAATVRNSVRDLETRHANGG